MNSVLNGVSYVLKLQADISSLDREAMATRRSVEAAMYGNIARDPLNQASQNKRLTHVTPKLGNQMCNKTGLVTWLVRCCMINVIVARWEATRASHSLCSTRKFTEYQSAV